MVSDRSGLVFPASEIVRQWDGLLVHKSEEEPRHPQEFVRGVVDDYAVRNPRPPAPYEATVSTGNTATFSVELVDRDGNELITRDGLILRTRGAIFSPNTNIIQADIGSIKSVSFVKFKFTEITAGKHLLNIYTSEDGSSYSGLVVPFVDAVRDFTAGDEVMVPIGRRARYVALRFEPIGVQVQSNLAISQFDVIGEV
jgi:hypothetical protein